MVKAPAGFASAEANTGGHICRQLMRLSSSGSSSPGGYGLISPAVCVVFLSVQLDSFSASPVMPLRIVDRGQKYIVMPWALAKTGPSTSLYSTWKSDGIATRKYSSCSAGTAARGASEPAAKLLGV